jgi:hypothetical protein
MYSKQFTRGKHTMDKTKRNTQFDAAHGRVIEAQMLMEGIAVHTTDSHAMDIQALLAKALREMEVFNGNIKQNLK